MRLDVRYIISKVNKCLYFLPHIQGCMNPKEKIHISFSAINFCELHFIVLPGFIGGRFCGFQWEIEPSLDLCTWMRKVSLESNKASALHASAISKKPFAFQSWPIWSLSCVCVMQNPSSPRFLVACCILNLVSESGIMKRCFGKVQWFQYAYVLFELVSSLSCLIQIYNAHEKSLDDLKNLLFHFTLAQARPTTACA